MPTRLQLYFPLSYGSLDAFPLLFSLSPSRYYHATNYGGYMGWGDILFAHTRTCQNGIVGVSRRIDIPRMVFIRVTGYMQNSALPCDRIVFSLSPPTTIHNAFFETRRISIFPLFLSHFCSLIFHQERIEPRILKDLPDV